MPGHWWRRAVVVGTTIVGLLVVDVSGRQKPRSAIDELWDDLAAESIGRDIGEGIGMVIKSMIDAKKAADEMTRRIGAARKAFWAEYPNGARRKEAEAEFARLLFEKDITIASNYVIEGCRSDRAWVISRMLSFQHIDGGIPVVAWTNFCNWIQGIRSEVRTFGDLASWAVIAVRRPEYETYRKARDWEESYRAGKVQFRTWADLFKSEKPAVYLLGLVYSKFPNGLSRDSQASFPERLEIATDTASTMAGQHGMDRLLATVAQVQKAPKVASGTNLPRLTNEAAGALGCTQVYVDACFWDLVRKYPTWKAPAATAVIAEPSLPVTDAERAKWIALAGSRDALDYARYASWDISKDRLPFGSEQGRAESAQYELASWTKQFGEDAIRRAVDAVRAVPKGPKGEIFDDAANRLGCPACSTTPGGCQPSYCLKESLFTRRVSLTREPVTAPAAGGRSGRPTPGGVAPSSQPTPSAAAGRGPLRPGQLPLKVKHVAPEFPASDPARYMVISVEITVGMDGRVTSARVRLPVREFGPAAIAAVKQWVFDPTGMTQPATGFVQVEFRK
jgi:hypothetical protein